MATDYNETVAVDLHELEHGVWYLEASIGIRSEISPVLGVCAWFPKKYFSDNGGEFNNEDVRNMAENFNIEVKTTAAYSP